MKIDSSVFVRKRALQTVPSIHHLQDIRLAVGHQEQHFVHSIACRCYASINISYNVFVTAEVTLKKEEEKKNKP